jgi:hypothetical protein
MVWLYHRSFGIAVSCVNCYDTRYGTDADECRCIYIKVNDLVFMGLSISISNINAWRRRVPAAVKDKAFSCSIIPFVVFSIALSHNDPGSEVSTPFTVLILVLLLIGIKLNLDIYSKKAFTFFPRRRKSPARSQ